MKTMVIFHSYVNVYQRVFTQLTDIFFFFLWLDSHGSANHKRSRAEVSQMTYLW